MLSTRGRSMPERRAPKPAGGPVRRGERGARRRRSRRGAGRSTRRRCGRRVQRGSVPTVAPVPVVPVPVVPMLVVPQVGVSQVGVVVGSLPAEYAAAAPGRWDRRPAVADRNDPGRSGSGWSDSDRPGVAAPSEGGWRPEPRGATRVAPPPAGRAERAEPDAAAPVAAAQADSAGANSACSVRSPTRPGVAREAALPEMGTPGRDSAVGRGPAHVDRRKSRLQITRRSSLLAETTHVFDARNRRRSGRMRRS